MRYFTTTFSKRITLAFFFGLIILPLFVGCSKTPPQTKKKVDKSSRKKISKKRPVQTKKLPKFFEESKPVAKPLLVYRPSDTRPQHDVAKLKQLGIHRYESKYLLLYTDIDPNIAKTLPAFIDAAYLAWEEYFGKLPADREKSVFQITGYIMKDKQLFKRLGLLPDDLRPFLNGRHRGAEFWMNEQKFDYYRRHLMIHEATHCFMTIMPNVNAPVWYMEGMAELFGTHRVQKNGKITFRTMPQTREEVAGLGRISLIRNEVKKGKGKFFSAVTNLKPNDYLKDEAYAWSWGLCTFLDSHPLYAKRFRELGRDTTHSQFSKTFYEKFDNDLSDIRSGWTLFVGNLQYGYNCKQSAPYFEKGTLLKEKKSHQCTVQSNLGWQSSKLFIEKGNVYQISAEGFFTLAQQPKPWRSEPDGISFRYFARRPLGQLIATIRVEKPTTVAEKASLLTLFSIGSQKKWKAPFSGTLYFRLNDSWSELVDNTGNVKVTIRTE